MLLYAAKPPSQSTSGRRMLISRAHAAVPATFDKNACPVTLGSFGKIKGERHGFSEKG